MSETQEPVVEVVTDPEEVQVLKHFRARRSRNELRNLVWQEIVKTAGRNASFKAAVEPLGIFAFMELVDGVVDAITTADAAGDPV